MMRGHDQQPVDGNIESLFAGTVGAQIPRSTASPAGRPSALGIRPRLTLIVAGVLAVVAIAAVVALTWHANAARDSEDRMDDIIVNLNGLQDVPWRLESSAGQRGTAERRGCACAHDRH